MYVRNKAGSTARFRVGGIGADIAHNNVHFFPDTLPCRVGVVKYIKNGSLEFVTAAGVKTGSPEWFEDITTQKQFVVITHPAPEKATSVPVKELMTPVVTVAPSAPPAKSVKMASRRPVVRKL